MCISKKLMVPNRINTMRSMPKHTIVKLLKYKEKYITSNMRKVVHIIQRNLIGLTADL
jgi:hypothetical protein